MWLCRLRIALSDVCDYLCEVFVAVRSSVLAIVDGILVAVVLSVCNLVPSVLDSRNLLKERRL